MNSTVAELVGPRRFMLAERELRPRRGEVVVRLHACGVCHTDMKVYLDGPGPDNSPVLLGHEGAGEVVELGPSTTGFALGDRVSGLFDQAFATHALAHVNRILPIPARLSYEESILEPLKCAITVARGAAYEVGDRLALVGCGYMGLLTAACLRGPALRELIAIDLEPKRLELALRFGATAIIDAREGPAAVEDRVRDLTNGELIDIAIEATGNSSGLELAGKVLRRGRPKLLMMGFHARPQPLDLSGFSAKGVILHTTVPAYSLDEQSDLRRAVWALESGLVETRSLVTHRFPLRDIGHAFEAALSPSPDYIKGVVVLS